MNAVAVLSWRTGGLSVTDTRQHDAWAQGANYDLYMGRWSRLVAAEFIDWMGIAPGARWCDFGSGTGALTEAVASRAAPAEAIGIDPSEGFISYARRRYRATRTLRFVTGSTEDMPDDLGALNVAVSGLVVNFVPDPVSFLRCMADAVRPDGRAGFYVWAYPGGGLQFVDRFWKAAVALDRDAGGLDEAVRFPDCTESGLQKMVALAGWVDPEFRAIEVPTVFDDFEDFWHPFTLGTGPAPGYAASLSPEARAALRDRLEAEMGGPGKITMTARAWAVKTRVLGG